MTSDHHHSSGAGNPHSPAPLSPDERIERATDSLVGELRKSRFQVAEQRARGEDLERQLAECRERCREWRGFAIAGWILLFLFTSVAAQ